MLDLDALDVKREELRLEEVVGEGTSQVVVSQAVKVPREKPPVRSVIDFVAKTTIDKVTVLPGKIVVDGTVDFAIIYEATAETQTVHVFHAEVKFSTFVEIPGAEPGMTAVPTLTIEHAVFQVSPDGKSVTIRAVAALSVRVTQTAIIEVITDVSGVPGLQVTKETINAETVLGEGEAQYVVRENLEIPCVKPKASRIIDQVSTIQVTSTTVLPNKIIINGTISMRVIYEAKVPSQSVHVAHFTIPFQSFVEIPGAQPGMTVVAGAVVEFVSIDVGPNGRTLQVRIILAVTAKVIRVHRIQVVTNVTGVPNLRLEKELVRVQEVLGENQSQGIVKEIVDVPREKPPVLAVLDSSSSPEVKRVIVAPGKVIVDGAIAQRIIYEPYGDETQQVHTLHFAIPFSEFVVLKEAKPGMVARVDVQVEHTNYEVPTQGEHVIMATKVVRLVARVFKTRVLNVVVKIHLKHHHPVCSGTVTGNLVNVRQGPGTTYAVVAQANAGTIVAVLEYTPDWVRIRLPNGVEGWISSAFVTHDCRPLG